MGFRYVIEKVKANGSREVSSSDFNTNELLVGRGGVSQLLLNSRLVSLVHTRFVVDTDKLTVEDLNSIAGTRVNDKKISKAQLVIGDKIQIGDIVLTLGYDAGKVLLTNVVHESVASDDSESLTKAAQSLNFDMYVPSMRILSLIAALVVAVLWGMLPLFGGRTQSWSSGPIANSHKMIETDCSSCHSKSFQHVVDTDCKKCHNMTDHAANLQKTVSARPDLDHECAFCHMDHNGDHGLITRDSRLCVTCHSKPSDMYQSTLLKEVPDFDHHPEFMVGVKDLVGNISHLPISDPLAKDRAQIKLNHALHLKDGLRGPDGPQTLECNSCHKLSPDFKTIEPISFDKNCRGCHSLGFDDRLPKAQVPHGDDDAVYPALFTEYTKLLLLKSTAAQSEESSNSGEPDFGGREKPGGLGVKPTPKSQIVNATSVENEARAAEKQLFLKTGCFLCHDAKAKATSDQTATNSHFTVLKPEIPSRWLGRSIFSHGAHEEISCESCHDQARKSNKTADILLPSINECKKCHSQEPRKSFVTSDCIMCHSYHDSKSMGQDHKRTTADYLSFVKRAANPTASEGTSK